MSEKIQKELATMLPIGKLAERTGVAVSAIRYYEKEGLIFAMRNAGGQRRFLKSDIRRLSFILIAQQMGFSLTQIKEAFAALPDKRTPTVKDWEALSKCFAHSLDEKIRIMNNMRENLNGCIGCGCLSLKKCKLYNPEDKAAKTGTGPRYLFENGA